MYHYGVVDDTDQRFQQSFEDVYNTPNLQTKWYLIAGNHGMFRCCFSSVSLKSFQYLDYRGNVSAQISYSSQSTRWNFPANYHSHQFHAMDGTSLDIIMIDTIDLAYINMIVDPNEPGYFDPLPEQPFARGAKQWAWIEAQLMSSRADHILVVGHYPVRILLDCHSACFISNINRCILHVHTVTRKL